MKVPGRVLMNTLTDQHDVYAFYKFAGHKKTTMEMRTKEVGPLLAN